MEHVSVLDIINTLIQAATFLVTVLAILYAIMSYRRDSHRIIVRHLFYQDSDNRRFIKIFVANVGRQPTTIADIGVLGTNASREEILRFNAKLVKHDLDAYRDGKSPNYTSYSGLAIEDDEDPFLAVSPGEVAGQPTKLSEEWAESLISSSGWKHVWAYAEAIERRLTLSRTPVFEKTAKIESTA